MIYKRGTGDLFTKDGVFIKRLHCPQGGAGKVTITKDFLGNLKCVGCRRTIVDTSGLGEDEMLRLATMAPKTCFAIDMRRCQVIP